MDSKKSIFEYNDYRAFLKDAYVNLKNENKNFSFRYFSRVAGFKSPSVLKQVINGQINIATNSIDKFSKAFKLNKEESVFFRHLVLLNQAKSVDEKQVHLNELLRCRAFKRMYPLSKLQANYYQHWYFIPVRELVNLKGFKEDPEWIAKKVSPHITPQEAKKALDELTQLGLLKRNSEGRLEQSHAIVLSGNEVASQALANFHKEMIKKAAESIDRFPREIRDITASTIGIPADSIKIIKEKVEAFRKELLELAAKSTGPNIVYQLNFQIFPVTEKVDGESK